VTLALDYSSGRPSAAAIQAADYDAVIRYVGTPGRTKNITAAEYQDFVANGVPVALVYEDVAQDALGGCAAGQASAQAARADADNIGFPAGRPIYFAVDWVATASQMPAIMAYLDGAADVLGVDCVGVYGFQLTIQTAMNNCHARWFWQCGARSALVPGTHLYQHNNDNTVVAGITCDVNDILQDDFGQYPTPSEDDMTPEQDVLLRDIHEQLCGNGSRSPGAYPGWGTWDGTGRNLTVVDLLREAHRETNQRIPSRVPGSTGVTETLLGYACNADAYGYQLLRYIGELSGRIDGLTAALGQLTQHGTVDLAAVTKAAEDGARAGLATFPIAADSSADHTTT
jgi:hypothetical protein